MLFEKSILIEVYSTSSHSYGVGFVLNKID